MLALFVPFLDSCSDIRPIDYQLAALSLPEVDNCNRRSILDTADAEAEAVLFPEEWKAAVVVAFCQNLQES